MDARNDDSSGGSDSLDKSLQLKCVVDDVGQGEGKQAEHNINEAASSNSEHKSDINNKSQHNKTEKSIGDCGGGGGGGGGVAETSTIATVADALNKRACDDNSTNTTTTTTNNTNAEERNFIESNNTNATNNNNNNINNNNAFESKVKQISKDLKETTLAEYNTTNESNASVLRSLSASSSSTSSTSGGGSDQLEQSEQLNVSDSTDDTRSKKVRFHPDVKENDGGNRVIRKKKKKLKGSAGEDSGTTAESSQNAQGADEDMDFEEEEDAAEEEEEEEFNLAKTIAEAQNYLKLHPLTFVKSNNAKSGPNMPEDAGKRLQNGLLQEEDLPLLSESSEEEDFYEEIIPECGVERILGKQVRNGKTLLLVRYVNDDGLYWESEERIASMCPTMMSKYEINRERRQERLMRHVAKRQNLRQRYTDF